MLEVNVEGIARSVREELGFVLREDLSQSLELDLDVVVSGSIGRSV